MSYTSYQPAVQIPRHRQGDPWPMPTYDQIMSYARAWFAYTCRPARPFPAANFCPLSTKPHSKTIRISTESLPVKTLAEWREEQEERFVFLQSPWPKERKTRKPRRVSWLERQVDKILAWQDRRRAAKQSPDESWLT